MARHNVKLIRLGLRVADCERKVEKARSTGDHSLIKHREKILLQRTRLFTRYGGYVA